MKNKRDWVRKDVREEAAVICAIFASNRIGRRPSSARRLGLIMGVHDVEDARGAVYQHGMFAADLAGLAMQCSPGRTARLRAAEAEMA